MYDQHDVAGRDITDSERWGGLLSATARVTDDLKVTLDYYHYTNEAIPDWGVPVLTRSTPDSIAAGVPAGAIHLPITEFGYSRDMFVGMEAWITSTSGPTSARRLSSTRSPKALR